MSEVWLDAQGVSKSFDGVKALAGFSCQVTAGEVVGLIGPNGAGKTTFFNVVSGCLLPDMGRIRFRGLDLLRVRPHRVAMMGIGRTFQELRLVRRLTVLDNALLACREHPDERLGALFFRWRVGARYEAEKRKAALACLEGFGLAGKAGDLAGDLSYGQQKLLSLACCLLSGADLLLLDEPVAGVAPEVIEKVLATIRSVRESGRSVLLIEHNIDAVMEVCDRVIFMDAGRVVSTGTPAEVRADPRVMEVYLGGGAA